MNRPVTVWVLPALLLMFLVSCKVGKQPVRRQVKIMNPALMKRYGLVTVDTAPGMVKTVPGTEPAQPKAPGTTTSETSQLVNALIPLWKKQVAFATFSSKAKMHYAGLGQKQEFTAHIRMLKDKVIWINVTALGGIVNVARIYITPDSIFLLNYVEREIFRMPITQANKLLPAPVDFDIMQNLIVGNALSQEGKANAAKDFGGTLSIEVESNSVIQKISFNKTDSTMRSLQMSTKDNQVQGMIQYGNYDMVSGKKFATSRAINLNNSGEPYYLDMNFNNTEFDQPVDMPFSIPKNYKLK